jgi:hypothetical protein
MVSFDAAMPAASERAASALPPTAFEASSTVDTGLLDFSGEEQPTKPVLQERVRVI